MPTLVEGFVVGSTSPVVAADGSEARRPTLLVYEVVRDEVVITTGGTSIWLDREAAGALEQVLVSFLKEA